MAEGTPFGRDSIVRIALRGVWRIGKEDEAEDVLEELRDLIPDYHRKRDVLTQIVGYLAAKREMTDPAEARAARILVTAIQMERI
jgi:putative DNA methylase